MTRRVLMLGAGQVGTFAARAISDAGAFVVAADLDPAKGFFWRYGPKEDVPLLSADVLDAQTLSELIRSHDVDTIVLSAGLTGQSCTRDPKKAWLVNVQGTESVAEAARRTGIRRLVFISTFAVYGRPAVNRIDETTPLNPQSEYGRTKAAAESIAAGLREEGTSVLILRPCGTYGPLRLGMGSQSAQLIESLLVGALNGIELAIEASPTTSDEYVYIKDLARAVALATLTETNGPIHIFNVGAGKKTTAQELCASLREVVPGARFRVLTPEKPESAPIPPLDVSSIREALGFCPRFDLIKGFTDYVSEARLQP